MPEPKARQLGRNRRWEDMNDNEKARVRLERWAVEFKQADERFKVTVSYDSEDGFTYAVRLEWKQGDRTQIVFKQCTSGVEKSAVMAIEDAYDRAESIAAQGGDKRA